MQLPGRPVMGSLHLYAPAVWARVLHRAQVRPGLQAHVSFDVTTGFLVLFALTAVCFLATGSVDPGVPERTRPIHSAGTMTLSHPGEEYQMSRDTNRCAVRARRHHLADRAARERRGHPARPPGAATRSRGARSYPTMPCTARAQRPAAPLRPSGPLATRLSQVRSRLRPLL